ncbi:phosphatidate cytidylyltransferase [Dongia sedimenti]|uniref:Phosphatidate cytidylyltransferase n=1 Tax=Dongia sedimenti TaxID=3064282 RepID=A0ABU0YK33_9PROT|nr:phosphatidate cytidylyltransferase [Rhodospirillaceae bacterium R-7]
MAAQADPSIHWSKKPLTLRLISAAVLIPIVVVAVYAGGIAWTLLVALFSIVMIVEWCKIAARRSGAVSWYALGIVYVFVPCAALIWLRNDLAVGLQQIFWIVALVIAADTGAYIAGRSIGGPKLAPRVSPNKTWAGLGGAVVSAAIVGAITALVMDRPTVWPLAAVSAGLAIIEQAGDLAESAFKRHFGVKDASHIIPGHGGALDRVDGLIAVAAAVAGINLLMGSSVLTWL